MKSQLDWRNLREDKCPQCGALFEHYTFDRVDCKCGFSIGEKRLKEIVLDMDTQDIDKDLDKRTDAFLAKYSPGRDD
jgi:hypothetical protein